MGGRVFLQVAAERDEEGERHTSPLLTSLPPPPFLLQVNPDTGIILSHIDVWDALEHNR